MKAEKGQERLAVRAPRREVSLHIRECQVTMKVRTPVPQKGPQTTLRWNQS